MLSFLDYIYLHTHTNTYLQGNIEPVVHHLHHLRDADADMGGALTQRQYACA